jgi:hypothetical protein
MANSILSLMLYAKPLKVHQTPQRAANSRLSKHTSSARMAMFARKRFRMRLYLLPFFTIEECRKTFVVSQRYNPDMTTSWTKKRHKDTFSVYTKGGYSGLIALFWTAWTDQTRSLTPMTDERLTSNEHTVCVP